MLDQRRRGDGVAEGTIDLEKRSVFCEIVHKRVIDLMLKTSLTCTSISPSSQVETFVSGLSLWEPECGGKGQSGCETRSTLMAIDNANITIDHSLLWNPLPDNRTSRALKIRPVEVQQPYPKTE